MLFDVLLSSFSIIAFLMIRAGFSNIFSQDRNPVGPADMAFAAFFFLLGIGCAVVLIGEYHDSAPSWLCPLAAISVSGQFMFALKFALGGFAVQTAGKNPPIVSEPV